MFSEQQSNKSGGCVAINQNLRPLPIITTPSESSYRDQMNSWVMNYAVLVAMPNNRTISNNSDNANNNSQQKSRKNQAASF